VLAPIVVDNTTFDDSTDFEALALDVLRGGGGYGAFRDDIYPLDWINRAYSQVESSPYASRLAFGVAACLTAGDMLVRAQALVFFQSRPFAAGDRITALVAGDRELFAGVDDPIHSGTDLEWQLLAALAARIGPRDSRALELARAEVLRPGKAAPLIASLAQVEPDWVVANAEAIVRGTPQAGATILIQLQGRPDVLALGRLLAPLCHGDARFELDVSRFIDSPDVRETILGTFGGC
jgi:hypothetical protein